MASVSETLERLKQFAHSRPPGRFPSIRFLAAQWDTSPRTVQLAVQRAVQDGWLETKTGSGIWTTGSRSPHEPTRSRTESTLLAETLSERIRTGAFETNRPLPSPKDLAKEFGAHPSTVRKAYALLESRQSIERTGRIRRIAPLHESLRAKASRLLCVGAAAPDGSLRMASDREWDFWREIQLEAIRCGLQPQLVPWESGSLPLESNCLGAIVSNWHMPDCEPVLDDLLRARIPTAVWSATDDALPGKRYQDVRGIWFHNLAHGREAGKSMGAFVSSLGHPNIAWISPFHGSVWSRNRLEGLRSALPTGFQVFESTHDWVSEWDVHVEIAWSPDTLRRVDLEGIIGIEDPDAIRGPLAEALTRQRCLEIFAPRLEAALESGSTLWIAGSDLIALWCLQWLKSRGLKVPRDLHLASFDDTRDATRQGLSSLRFDVQSMARAMVRQVLSSRRHHPAVTRYSGFVVERESTGRVR